MLIAHLRRCRLYCGEMFSTHILSPCVGRAHPEYSPYWTPVSLTCQPSYRVCTVLEPVWAPLAEWCHGLPPSNHTGTCQVQSEAFLRFFSMSRMWRRPSLSFSARSFQSWATFSQTMSKISRNPLTKGKGAAIAAITYAVDVRACVRVSQNL